MSYVVTYKVEGLSLDASVFKKLISTPEELNRINSLEGVDEETMSLKDFRELQNLTEQKNKKTAVYNDCRITSKNYMDEPEACCYYDPFYNKVIVPGHEGQDLVLVLNDTGTYFIPKDGYFDDNYDSSLDLVHQVIKAFKCTCLIKYTGDEANSDEEVHDMYYVDGIQK